LYFDWRPGSLQCLQIRIGYKKFDALDAGFDHAVHGIAAAPADTDYFYARTQWVRIIINENINASIETSVLCHSDFLSSEAGRLPGLLSSMLGSSRHRHRYIADYILCNRGESIQQLVKKYY
jgi:hypothetical protein